MLSNVGSSGSQGTAGAAGGDDGQDRRGSRNGGVNDGKPEPAKTTKGALELPAGSPINSGAMAAAASALAAATASASASNTSAANSAEQSLPPPPSDGTGAHPRRRNQDDVRLNMPEEGSKKSTKKKGWKGPTRKQVAFGGLLLASAVTTRYMMQSVGNLSTTPGDDAMPMPPGSSPLPDHQGAGAPFTTPSLPSPQMLVAPPTPTTSGDVTNDDGRVPMPPTTQTDADLAIADAWLDAARQPETRAPREPRGAEGGAAEGNAYRYRNLQHCVRRRESTTWHISGIWTNSVIENRCNLPLRVNAMDGDTRLDRTLEGRGDSIAVSHRPGDRSFLDSLQIQVDTRAIRGADTTVYIEGGERAAQSQRSISDEHMMQMRARFKFSNPDRRDAIAAGAEMTFREMHDAFEAGLINIDQFEAMSTGGEPRILPEAVRGYLRHDAPMFLIRRPTPTVPTLRTELQMTEEDVAGFASMFRGHYHQPTTADLLENFDIQIFTNGRFLTMRPSDVSVSPDGVYLFTFEGNPHNFGGAQDANAVLIPRDLQIYRPGE